MADRTPRPLALLLGLALVLVLLSVVSGCTLAPRYERPTAPVPSAWPDAGAAPAGSSSAPAALPAAELGWRDVFVDPRLQALIALALEHNRDLRMAAENVELARAQYRIQRAPLLPSVAATAGYSRAHTPADLSVTGAETTAQQWSVGASASWELDFFGRAQSLAGQAREQYLATEEAHRAAHLAVVGEVASQYVALAALDEQLEVARRTLANVEASIALTRRSYEVGRSSQLDLRSAESQVEAARYEEVLYRQRRAQAENALVLLVGHALPAEPPAVHGLVEERIRDVTPGLPSDILERRPDILQAEHALRAANASIGAARAAFFPSISLTASGGTGSAQLSGLFGSGSGIWSFAPQLNLPIFTGGQNSANLDAAQVRKRIEIAAYEKAIQVAFREVSDALVARALAGEQVGAQAARVRAEQQRYDLSEVRYRTGMDSYLNVLTAQQSLYGAQQLLIATRQAQLTNLIALYQALGGGWSERSSPLASR